jgi:nucleoid DNA-binding protein
MLDYYLEQNRVPEDSTEYYAVVTHSARSSQTDFVRILGKTLGGVTEGETQRVLAAVSMAAQEQFMEGRPFSIEGLGTFSLSVHGSFPSPDTPWDAAVNKVAVSFRADKTLSVAAGKAPLNRLHGVVHGPVIDSVIDAASNSANQRVTSGHNVRLVDRPPILGWSNA